MSDPQTPADREALAAFEEWWRRHCQAVQAEPDNRATYIARVAFLAAWNSRAQEAAALRAATIGECARVCFDFAERCERGTAYSVARRLMDSIHALAKGPR